MAKMFALPHKKIAFKNYNDTEAIIFFALS